MYVFLIYVTIHIVNIAYFQQHGGNYENYKKIAYLFLVVVLIFSQTTFIFADSPEPANETSSEYIEIPIYNSYEEYSADKAQLESKLRAAQPRKTAIMYPFFIRSGDTTKVEVYYSYEGPDAANAIKIKDMEIWNASLLHRKLLAELDPGIINFKADKLAKIRIDEVDIPTKETALRVNVKLIQVYILNVGWLSGNDPIGQWTINQVKYFRQYLLCIS